MKQSTDGLFSVRLLSRKMATGVLAAAIAGASACGGHTTSNCPNLAIANGLMGQLVYTIGTPNTGGISASTLGGPRGSVAVGSGATPFYVPDTLNNRLLGYNSTPGSTTTVGITATPPAGSLAGPANFELGQGDSTGTDFIHNSPNNALTAPTGSTLSNPTKVTISEDGTMLVVADSGNNRVLIWKTLPTTNAPADIVIGQADFVSNGQNQTGSIAANTLSNPTAAAISGNHLIVVDQGNSRVLIWNNVKTGSTVNLVSNQAANVVLGQADFTHAVASIDSFSGTTQSYTLAMDKPTDVFSNGTDLIVSDTGNNRVLFWNGIPSAQNQLADFVIGQTTFGQNTSGSGNQHLKGPTGVGSDNANLYVADTQNNRVLEFPLVSVTSGLSATGVFGQEDFGHVDYNDADQTGGPGSQQNSQTNLNPTQNTLFAPQGVAALPSGQLFVTDSDNYRVVQFRITDAVNGTLTSNCNGINPQF